VTTEKFRNNPTSKLLIFDYIFEAPTSLFYMGLIDAEEADIKQYTGGSVNIVDY
jgi:hypothetical protein